MESVHSSRHIVAGVLATVATALMFYFGNGLEPWWPLMWLAPLPVLSFALRSSWRASALAAVVSMLLGNLNLWSYFTKTLGAPASVWFEIATLVAIVFAGGVLLFRALVRRGAAWSGLVALPSVWVLLEYLRNVLTPHGSAGSLAYSQLRFLPFLQLASVTGPWGMTFVLLLFSSALAIGWHLRRAAEPRRAKLITATGVGIAVAVIALGAVRLAMPGGDTARIGLLASDLKPNANVTDPGQDTERLFGDYARAAEGLTAQGAQAIVIPEKLGVTLEGKSADTDAIMQSLASRTGAEVVAGVVHVDGSVKYNEARVYEPGRSSVERYDKEHMLPPFESDLKPGTTLVLLPKQKQLWGVAICKDMDFANPARQYAKQGAGLLLVPAWDFKVDRSWHGHIAIMRGVEGGFSIARAAKNGYLTVSDWRGRIVGEQSSSAADFATLIVDVPAIHRWTVYQTLGDWFVWVAIVLFVFTLPQLVRRRPQEQA